MPRLVVWILSVGLLALSTGCGNQQNGDAARPGPGSGPPRLASSKGIIGVSVLTLTNPFFKVIGDTIAAEGRKQGYDVIVVSGEFDVARQQNQVKDFIVKKVAAIVLCPCDSRSIGPAIEEAGAAGIPVFTADIAC